MLVLYEGTCKRISISGTGVTLRPGLNEIRDDVLAKKLISRGHVKVYDSSKESNSLNDVPKSPKEGNSLNDVPESPKEDNSLNDVPESQKEDNSLQDFEKLTKKEIAQKLILEGHKVEDLKGLTKSELYNLLK